MTKDVCIATDRHNVLKSRHRPVTGRVRLAHQIHHRTADRPLPANRAFAAKLSKDTFALFRWAGPQPMLR